MKEPGESSAGISSRDSNNLKGVLHAINETIWFFRYKYNLVRMRFLSHGDGWNECEG